MTSSSFFRPEQTFGTLSREEVGDLSGRELLEKMLSGEVPFPPIYKIMNIKMTEVDDGRTRFIAQPGPDHYNPIGMIHGGWIGTMMDAALASCIHTKVGVGQGLATAEYKVNIVRSLTSKSGQVHCEGNVLHFGRTIATSEARLYDEKDRLIAHGIETCSIFPVA